mmetsp:Transcript_7407/g.16389  ORF Transcript_7407/g.16389 Transcript_7407/m.16389 type:complete len:183 (-) Transcript_7407:93-641(-)
MKNATVLSALLFLAGSWVQAFTASMAPTTQATTTSSQLHLFGTLRQSRPAAAASFEEDLQLTLQVILDHQARSTTTDVEQMIVQQQQAATSTTSTMSTSTNGVVDLSVPYDAAARLAYESSSNTELSFQDFIPRYRATAVIQVMEKMGKTPSRELQAQADGVAPKRSKMARLKSLFSSSSQK